MFTGIVDWWSESRGCDRFELERQFDVLARAILSGLDQSLLERGGRSGTAASGHAASMARKAGVRRRRRSV
jgi:hypothetical protein